ncbi:MAG: hypothetical protein M3O20_07080 [Acidobacteriota bacterium]|nr:hypothetical protein [Acidobacteriota bacterium]
MFQSLPVDDGVKAQAYSDFTAAKTPQDFQQRFDALPLPRPIKAQLWDLRFGAPNAPVDPQRFVEAAGMPPSVEDASAPPSSMGTAPTSDPAPPPQTALDLPVKPLRPAPQPAQSIGALPPVTGATEVEPQTPPSPQGPQVNVPMSATPAMNANGPTSSSLYQRVTDISRANPSFGSAKIQRETGARHADIAAALDRLVNEGAIKRTQNARRSVVYHATPQQSEGY